ncbi:MAG: cupredoxin domain-containing protein, partial [Dehalococcoidia bacterium]
QVFVNGQAMDNWSRYIPQDGDAIRIVFGPEVVSQVSTDSGIVIPPEEATREIAIEAGDRGVPDADSFFLPSTFTIDSGETVKVNVTNTGTVTHNLRVEGVDKEYGTDDDFVTRFPGQASALIGPGEEWFTVVRIDEPGQYAFRCDIHPNIQFGTLTVAEDGSAPPQGTSTPEATAAAP